MVAGVLEQTADWKYVGVSVGVPAPVVDGRVVREPVNLGTGWVGFDFEPRSASRRRSSTTRRCRRSELRRRAHALPRPRHRPRHDADHRRRLIAPDGARAPPVPQGDVRGLRRRGRARARRPQALEEGGRSRRSSISRRRFCPTTSCSAAATRASSASCRRTAGSATTRTPSSAASASGSSERALGSLEARRVEARADPRSPSMVTSAAGWAAAISGSVANCPWSGRTVVTRSPQNAPSRR